MIDQTEVLSKLIEKQKTIENNLSEKTDRLDDKIHQLQDKINATTLASVGKRMNKDTSKTLALSDDRLSFLVASGEYKKIPKLVNSSDRSFTEFEYKALLNKANNFVNSNDYVSRESLLKELTPREQEVYRLSLLNEGLIIPEFLGIYNCNTPYTLLSDLYSHVQVSSEEYKYIIAMDNEYDYASLISDCAAGCLPSDKLDIDFNARVKSGNMLKFDSSVCTTRVSKTYYADTLRFEAEQVVSIYRKAREYALINSSVGWLKQSLTGVGFEMYKTAVAQSISFTDIITAIASFSANYSALTVVLHPNVFTLLMTEYTMLGQPLFALDEFNERVYSMLGMRVRFVKSSLLPDATQNFKYGGDKEKDSLPSGSFAFAVADWKEAYTAVNYQDIQFKYISVDSFFCDKLLAGAKFSGFIKCPSAGKIVTIR